MSYPLTDRKNKTKMGENITSLTVAIRLEKTDGEMPEIQHLKHLKFVFSYAKGILIDC